MKIGNSPRKPKGPPDAEEALAIAIAALAHLAESPDRIGRFAALSGLDPRAMRAAAERPGFFPAVLGYFAGHEPDLLAFAEASGIDPARIAAARAVLEGGAAP